MQLVPARPKVYVVVWTTAVFTIPEQTSADLLEDTCAWAREGQHLIRSCIQSSFRHPLSLPPSATSHALLPVPAVIEELDQNRRHQQDPRGHELDPCAEFDICPILTLSDGVSQQDEGDGRAYDLLRVYHS